MMLCLDVGNSQIYGGVFDDDRLVLQFRRASMGSFSSDEVGVFLRSVIKENDIDPSHINKISICTVVPEMLHSIRNACRKYFKISPFVLQAGVKTGLNIKYHNPLELGADRIANAIAATHLFPDENLIIVDMGTATTFCAVSRDKEFLGGAIIPGLRISVDSLGSNTAKLPTVEIVEAHTALGRSTVEGIQGGLYYSTVGGVREITGNLIENAFPNQDVKVIGTGGVARIFEKENLFDVEVPDLILKGLYISYLLNLSKKRTSDAIAYV